MALACCFHSPPDVPRRTPTGPCPASPQWSRNGPAASCSQPCPCSLALALGAGHGRPGGIATVGACVCFQKTSGSGAKKAPPVPSRPSPRRQPLTPPRSVAPNPAISPPTTSKHTHQPTHPCIQPATHRPTCPLAHPTQPPANCPSSDQPTHPNGLTRWHWWTEKGPCVDRNQPTAAKAPTGPPSLPRPTPPTPGSAPPHPARRAGPPRPSAPQTARRPPAGQPARRTRTPRSTTRRQRWTETGACLDRNQLTTARPLSRRKNFGPVNKNVGPISVRMQLGKSIMKNEHVWTEIISAAFRSNFGPHFAPPFRPTPVEDGGRGAWPRPATGAPYLGSLGTPSCAKTQDELGPCSRAKMA